MTPHAKQPCIVLTGMHRSGTSLAASLLQASGLNLGAELLEANDGNKEGYYEDTDFVRFHEDALSAVGISKEGWSKQSSVGVQEKLKIRARELITERRKLKDTWGWKDPRTVLFLEFWRQLLPEARFVFVYRPPWEVLDSLFRRRNVGDEAFENNPNLAIETYIAYGRAVLKFVKQHPELCLVLEAKSIINDPASLSSSVEERFAIPLRTPSGEQIRKSAFREENESFRPSLVMQFFPEAVEIYREMTAAANERPEVDYEVANTELYKKWVLQDWVRSRRLENTIGDLEKALENETNVLRQADNDRQKLFKELEKKYHEIEQANTLIHESDVNLYKAARKLQIVEDSVFWKARSVIIKVLSALKLYRPSGDLD